MAMLQTLTEFVCVLSGGIFVDVMRISPRDPANVTMATPPLFPQLKFKIDDFLFVRKKNTFFSISSNWSLISRTAAQKESDLILNGIYLGEPRFLDRKWISYEGVTV